MKRISHRSSKSLRPAVAALAFLGVAAGTGILQSTRAEAKPLTPTITVTGRVVRDADDNNFQVRTTGGRIYRVETSRLQKSEAWNKLQAGDMIRVNGEWRDEMIHAGNLRYLGKGYVEPTRRVAFGKRTYRTGDSTNVVGTLVSDADDDEFELRDNRGRTYMIRTRLIPDYRGANKLQEGDRVRVNGYWFVSDNKSQMEAKNFRLLNRR